jgi:Nif-specific regulatory protein
VSHRTDPNDVARLRLERDLFLRLLEIGGVDDVLPFLQAALALIVGVTQARKGYIELYGDVRGGSPRFSMSSGLSAEELLGVRQSLSTGIIGEALATGRTVSTASALEDQRFKRQASVIAQGIRAVLCAPMGAPSIGVLYLTDRPLAGPFTQDDVAYAELFARHASPLAERLLAREQAAAESDHTAALREKLQVGRVAGRSRALAEVFRMLTVARDVTLPVLFTGESGTGKSAFARALHDSSPRASRPFVDVNCAAIPEGLFESELFGAEKGAHSTAVRRMEGKIDAANGGTLFLDEVGDMPLAVQGKLLVFLQSRRYYRLGSATPIDADVRIVAATNADPAELVQAKRFREDLFYRLNVLGVHIPPLRDRREDIAPIAEAIVGAIGRDHGKEIALTRAARLALAEGEWPGNVRQLENTLQRGWAIAASEGAIVIEPRHVYPEKPRHALPAEESTYEDATRRFQRAFLEQELARQDWNVSETARRIGIARSHLNDLVRAHGLVRVRPSNRPA